jgi:D-glycero-alpha-D-manno-heptose-7-phosphate kinase
MRVSFLGGNTDVPQWYNENGGHVLTTTIDKYCYVFCKELLPYFEHNIRAVYSLTETVNEIDELTHPLIRETLRYLNIKHNIEIQHSGDLPARSGLASSSAFAVGLLSALSYLKEVAISPIELASIAYHIEREILGEQGGKQDQYACAYGGLNYIEFNPDISPKVERVDISSKRKHELESMLMLFYLNSPRMSFEISKQCIANYGNKKSNLTRMSEMVGEGLLVLRDPRRQLEDLGLLLDEYWQLKRDLSDCVSNEYIDTLYKKALQNGAIGGKINGAGAGGTMLLLVQEENQEKVIEAMLPAIHVPFKFDFTGSMVIYSG